MERVVVVVAMPMGMIVAVPMIVRVVVNRGLPVRVPVVMGRHRVIMGMVVRPVMRVVMIV